MRVHISMHIHSYTRISFYLHTHAKDIVGSGVVTACIQHMCIHTSRDAHTLITYTNTYSQTEGMGGLQVLTKSGEWKVLRLCTCTCSSFHSSCA
jgi:hypothetical protein